MRSNSSRPWFLFVVVFGLGASLHYLPFSRRDSNAPSAALSFPSSIPLLSDEELPSLALVEAIADFNLIPEGFPDSGFSTTICATPTHEEDFLAEWLTWHRLAGIQRFYLFQNEPSETMRETLRPWLDEGSVVLFEVEFPPGMSIAQSWLRIALNTCRSLVMPVSRWTLHIDMDEFLVASAPGWAPSIPSLDPSDALGWRFPLEDLLAELAKKHARCVPLLRVSIENVGMLEWDGGLVTRSHTTRLRVDPKFHAWGKMLLHPDYSASEVYFAGPHTCQVLGSGLIVNAFGQTLPNPYPEEGIPLPNEGLVLHHYGQRSLANCFTKLAVVAQSAEDWRTKDGPGGCARNYLHGPVDSEEWRSDVERVVNAAVKDETVREKVLKEALRDKTQRMEDLINDRRAREGWIGRMTKEITDEWKRRGRIGRKGEVPKPRTVEEWEEHERIIPLSAE